ncbi:hypothetical protein ELQ90_09545 [Labedella phragmitis]|uniref:Uncharacterized protein n=1 Tax=Labedella phragmitis TaxID=2498849 RepID=A0A3S4A438_9MICO|nr:hypothetical protein [Labedella phragmitis]RWZ51032.1 hypothetical protein ELQ90_09545 [Labedella phragmitis]
MTLDIHSTRTAAGRARAAAARTTPESTTRSVSTHSTLIRAGVVETVAHEELVLDRVSPSLLRVMRDDRVLGFVEHVGRVYVALSGEHYDRAVEVAQSLDVTRAARSLV